MNSRVRQFCCRSPLWILFLAVGFLFVGESSGRAADKLRVSNCFIGGAILPLRLAQDAGLFQREGLDVELIWIQGNPAGAAPTTGEIDLLHCIPHNFIRSMAGGAELVISQSV